MKYLIEFFIIALVFFYFISCVEEKQEEDFAGFTEIASEKNTRTNPRYTADTTTEVDSSIGGEGLLKVITGLKGQTIRTHLLNEKDRDRKKLIKEEVKLLHSLPHWTDREAGDYYRKNGYGVPYTPQSANPYTQSVFGQPNGVSGISKTGRSNDNEIIALLELTEFEVNNRIKRGDDVKRLRHPEYGWWFLAYKWGATPGGGINLGILPEKKWIYDIPEN